MNRNQSHAHLIMKKHAGLEEEFRVGEDDGYDAVVVGSGYGGSIAACRMSMAGIKVCLVEKGRRWEAEDFPTNSLKFLSTTRLESRSYGFSFGPKDGLFQVHEQGDSAAVMACGLGGGSLINGGVMLPTPVRARRNPKWPKEWERDWDIHEASASAMLRIQNPPDKFPIARVMKKLAEREMEDNFDTSIKLSVNFHHEEAESNAIKSKEMGTCLACGNCLSGCPYNAKNSTDKNYLRTAIQAGCHVRTGCQVKLVVQNQFGVSHTRINEGRRWRVYFNETDYVTSDFVILSAGVFGTTDILFQSRMRGLRLSEALGCGFSSNGNNVAFLVGSPAPLNGCGLKETEFSKIPFQERPGPSITTYHTSSLGFTIQPAIVPRACPYLLLKGILTYGWPDGYWFFHGVIDKLKNAIGLKSSQAVALNVMGYDSSNGKITLDRDADKISFHAAHDPLFPRKLEAVQKLAKKLGGFLFLPRYRSTAVHLLGGCIVASDSLGGVCNHKGQVFDPESSLAVHKGLYVCDASLIPCSVGINPALTIAAAAEYVSKHLVQDALEYKSKRSAKLDIASPGNVPSAVSDKIPCDDHKSTVLIKEIMRGRIGGVPCTAYLKMKMNSNNKKFMGWNQSKSQSHPLLRGKVGGYVTCRAIDKDKLHIVDGEVDLCTVDFRTPYTQYMCYHLLLATSSGSRYVLKGKKITNPFLLAMYAWKETTTLHVTVKEVAASSSRDTKLKLKGELRVSFTELLRSIMSLEGNRRGRFILLFIKSLLRSYIFQIPRGRHMDFIPSDSYYKPYPSSSLHEIKTDDGCVISCMQWKGNQDQSKVQGDTQKYPVLLLNGYYGECYWLPTEPRDLVRTLLEEGHDVWLLQPRLHPLSPVNDFNIEDIGKYDIPSAIRKILELHGPSMRIHIIAHCLGGLAIHMAIMGGHVSAANIASLSCTNSSMFFKLTTFATVKMWLPLVPIAQSVMGKNKILPLLEEKEVSSPRHQLLKCIAQCIPRPERCTCKECEVVSGIFGNAFWHQNVSPTYHHWMTKISSTMLPMSAFPHLRMVCKFGFIVDSRGNNSYLCHPERMAVSTLYVSGGRTLLVTPETSFLANKYMKLHQPGFRHERVVVEEFGHSDLLIGENSYKKVFPHILSHMKLAEKELKDGKGYENKRYSKEALDWGDDPLIGEYGGSGSCFYPAVLALVCLFICLFISLLIQQ